MLEEAAERIRARKPKMAICYDFDKTLSPDDMQTFTLIPSLGMDSETFWKESNELASDHSMEKNLAWMYKLLMESRAKRQKLSRTYFCSIGKDIKLFEGVETWFDRINKYAEQHHVEVEHYIISSGLKELVEGTSIAKKFKKIYASSYLYDADGVAEWPAQAVNYTNKTQYIFRIAKGILDEYDDRVNDSMPKEQLYIPYENIVYVGDSATDIPCMRLVKSKGGYSIGVFDPEKMNREKVYQLFNDKRINFFAPADYRSQGDLCKYMKQIIDEVAAKDAIRAEQEILNLSAGTYEIYKGMEKLADMAAPRLGTKEKKKMNETLNQFKEVAKEII